jgi:hypothetical protein
MTGNVVANLFHKYLGPHIAGVLKNWESANRPKMDQFEIFSTNSCTKSKLKGGQCHFLYFVPHIVGSFGHIGG